MVLKKTTKKIEETDTDIDYNFDSYKSVDLADMMRLDAGKGFETMTWGDMAASLSYDSFENQPDDVPKNCGYGKKFRFKVPTREYGVGYDWIYWCKENCNSTWGWYFEPNEGFDEFSHYENNHAIMTFRNKKDAVFFALSHDLDMRHD